MKKKTLLLHCEDSRRRRELTFVLTNVARLKIVNAGDEKEPPHAVLIVDGLHAASVARQVNAQYPHAPVLRIGADLDFYSLRQSLAVLRRKPGPKRAVPAA